jgi:hypothetical protein
MPGRPMHPQPRVRYGSKYAHEYSQRATGNHPAFPHAMVLTAYIALSPVIGFLVTVICGSTLVRARSGRHATANLTPASRRQDHTTSLSASAPFVSPPLIAHRCINAPALPSRACLTLPRPPHPTPRL